MRNYFSILLLIWVLVFSGCSLPVERTSDGLNDRDTSTSERSGSDYGTEEDEQKDIGSVPKADDVVKAVKLNLTLYYQDNAGYVVPVTRKVDKQEGIAKAAVTALVDSTINREETEYYGIYPVLPQGTEVRGINLKEGIATIDFNDKFASYKDKAAERNIIASVVYTLTEFKTIDGVKILVNGKSVEKLKYGTDVSGIFNRDNTLLNSDSVNIQEGYGKSDIFLLRYINDKYVYAIPVSFQFKALTDLELPAKMAELLCKDYEGTKLYSEIPSGTKILEASIKDDVLTLDFNSKLREYGGNAREDGILKQILYSARYIKGVNKVKVRINGKGEELPEGTDISKDIRIPAEINNYVDND